MVVCPAAVSAQKPNYQPVIYLDQVNFSSPTATSFTIQGSDGTILAGPFDNVATFAQSFRGTVSTNPCAPGSNLVAVFGTAPSSAFALEFTYWYQ